jgi:hypothetical protein
VEPTAEEAENVVFGEDIKSLKDAVIVLNVCSATLYTGGRIKFQ